MAVVLLMLGVYALFLAFFGAAFLRGRDGS